MFSGLGIFKMASALAGHAATRQSLVAQNIANADTPAYKAVDTAPFAETFSATEDAGLAQEFKTTRAGHIREAEWSTRPQVGRETIPGNMSPNGNSVSLESEMVKATEAKHAHELALATYRGGLDLLRTSFQSGS